MIGKVQAEAREHSMKKEFSTKLNELEEQYTALKEELEHTAKLDKDEIREVCFSTYKTCERLSSMHLKSPKNSVIPKRDRLKGQIELHRKICRKLASVNPFSAQK